MTRQQILEAVAQHPAQKVKIAVADIDGVLRGKVVHKDKFMSIAESGFGFCDVVFGWDAADESYDNGQLTGWHTGYPDAPARIDLRTFRQIPWEDNLPFFLADFSGETEGEDFPACPRSLLKRVLRQAEDMGFAPVFAQEFEWFTFAETPESWAEKGYVRPQPMTPGMFGYSILRSSLKSPFFNDLFDLLGKFGVPVEGLHTETGPGVYEAAILYTSLLEAADRAVLFKTAVKEIAYRHGLMASFMAKWDPQLPGCSGHVHQSLWDPEKQTNLFYDAADPEGMSPLMRHYVAGQLHALPQLLPLIAPTINSYKRLVEGLWAPTTLTWGRDNRTTALRTLTDSAKSARLETRIVGSDVNPYLAMAACLAAGLYGIEQKLELQPKTEGNGYTEKAYGTLARNLAEATAVMKQAELARKLLGEGFVDHFVRSREWEWRQFSLAVTDWELKRYFEII